MYVIIFFRDFNEIVQALTKRRLCDTVTASITARIKFLALRYTMLIFPGSDECI